MADRFQRFHPLVSFIYYGGAAALLVLMLHPIFLSAAFFLILFFHFWEDRGRNLLRWLFFMLTSGFFLLLLNPLFNERGRHVVFIIFQHRFTLESFVYGGISALSIMGIIALFVSYNEVMTPNKILFLFSKFLPQFAVLLMLTLRFIPLMKRRAEEVVSIQNSKGIFAAQGAIRSRLKIGMLFIQALLVHSLEEAIQTADSMKARGYGGKNRTSYEYFYFKRADWLAAVYLLALFSLTAFGRYCGFGYLTVYPLMEDWHLTNKEAIILGFESLYLSFPLMVNIGGMIRWRLSR